METWIAQLYYRMYNLGFGVSIPVGARNPSLFQSIQRRPTGHRDKELFRGFKRPAREFNSFLQLVSKYRMSGNIRTSFLPLAFIARCFINNVKKFNLYNKLFKTSMSL
jgi:hypothetical protein